MGESSGRKRIQIDVISDTVCPWCFVGKKNLDKAMEQSKDRFDFEVPPLPPPPRLLSCDCDLILAVDLRLWAGEVAPLPAQPLRAQRGNEEVGVLPAEVWKPVREHQLQDEAGLCALSADLRLLPFDFLRAEVELHCRFMCRSSGASATSMTSPGCGESTP